MKFLFLYFLILALSIVLAKKIKSGLLNFLTRTIYRFMSLGLFVFLSSKLSLKLSFLLVDGLVPLSSSYYSLVSSLSYLSLLGLGLVLSFMATIKVEYLLIDGENKNVFNDLIVHRKK